MPTATHRRSTSAARASRCSRSGGDIIPAYIDANITVPVERYSVNAHFGYEFSDNLTGFIDGTYGHVDGQLLQTSFFNTAIPIFADNPFIPDAIRDNFADPTQPTGPASLTRPANATAAFTMARLFNDLARGYSTSDADTYRITTGLEGEFGGGWTWDGYYQYSRTDRLQVVQDNLVVGAAVFPVTDPATIAQSNAYFYFAADAVIDPATNQPTLPRAAERRPRSQGRSTGAACRSTCSAKTTMTRRPRTTSTVT